MAIKSKNIKIENLTGANGKAIPNQFVVHNVRLETSKLIYDGTLFVSYQSNIAFVSSYSGTVFLDKKYWDHSNTTGKYRNLFLGETKKETEAKIKSGVYKLVNLNE